jgi:hypothetical protein
MDPTQIIPGNAAYLVAFIAAAIVTLWMMRKPHREPKNWRFSVHQWKGRKLDPNWLANHMAQATFQAERAEMQRLTEYVEGWAPAIKDHPHD